MAFCPQCGKSVTDQASKCLACGSEFEPRAKGARFKGTMMMSPGAAASVPQRPATPAAGTEQPAAAAVPPPPAPQPAPRAPTPAPSKVGKATMLGTGGAGLAPPIGRPSAQSAAALPKAPPPAAAAPAAAAPAARDESDPALAATTRQQTDASIAGTEREDSKRLLVGDPMAQAPSAQTGGRAARRASDEAAIPGVNAPSAGKLLGVAIGGVVLIALVGYLAARYMGLLN
jgi:hypothetical protein